jgi:hypothetical protein
MRTIPGAFTTELDSSRAVGLRYTIRDNRLIFTGRSFTEGISVDEELVDSCTYSTGILRVANVSGTIYSQYESAPSDTTWPAWVNTGITCIANQKIAVEGGRLFYTTTGGHYYRDWGGSSFGGATEILSTSSVPHSTTYRYGWAPCSTTRVFVMWTNHASPDYAEIAHCLVGTSAVNYYRGRIYEPNVYRVDAAFTTSYDFYLYTVEGADEHPIYIRHFGWFWGQTERVLPVDILDTTSNFEFGAVNVIDGKVVVTGKITRGEAPSPVYTYEVYMFGPERHSLGRDRFITDFFGATNVSGKLYQIGTKAYFVAFGGVAEGDATNLLGYDHASHKVQTEDIHSLQVSTRGNQAFTFSSELISNWDNSLLRKNSEVTVEFIVGGEYAQLGVFNVDVLSYQDEEEGRRYNLGGRSAAVKRLNQWASDQDFDYWSQTKVSTNPSTLSEVIRVTGLWENVSDKLELEDTSLNVDGFLYMAAKANRGGSIRAKFHKEADSVLESTYGVGLNFYKETRAEAAERLGVEPSEINEEDFGVNGLFAIYGDDVHSGGEGVAVYHYVDGTPTKLTSASHTVADATDNWLMLEFSDGNYMVKHRLDASTIWSSLIDEVFEEAGENPWPREYLGRGAVYAKNKTDNSVGYPFSSTDTVIPVVSNTAFPTSETVIVDTEQIDYNGKSPNLSVTDLDVVEGVLWPDNEHNNAEFDDIAGILFANEYTDDTDTDSDVKIGYEDGSGNNVAVGALQFIHFEYLSIIYEIWVYMRTVGTPTDDIEVQIIHDDIDNYNYPPSGSILGTSQSHTAITGSYSWVKFYDFDGVGGGVEIPSGSGSKGAHFVPDNYGFYVHRANDAVHAASPSTNYYEMKSDTQLRQQTKGVVLVRQTGSTGYWYVVGNTNPRGWGDLPYMELCFRASGSSIQGAGYPIWIDGNGSQQQRNYYNDCALVVTDGPGKGSAFKIVDYDWKAPADWVPSRNYQVPDRMEDHVGDAAHGSWDDTTNPKRRVFVDRRPTLIGPDSTVDIRPGLVVTTRGVGGTNATSHGPDTTLVSVYTDKSVLIDQVDYHSADVDMALEDMADEIAAKAGVLTRTYAADTTGTGTYTGDDYDYFWLSGPDRRDFIVDLQVGTAWGVGDRFGVIFRCEDQTPSQGYILEFAGGPTAVGILLKDYTGTMIEDYYLTDVYDLPVIGSKIRISVQGSVFSVWVNGKFVHTFVDTTYPTGETVGCIGYGTFSGIARWPELDMYVDNFILDMGHRGTQLLTTLIGDKRVLFMDDQDGGLYMARLKSTGSSEYTLQDLTVAYGEAENDSDQLTRVRSEGAEIAELVDLTELQNEGSLFTVVNAREANNLWQTEVEGLAVLEDARTTSTSRSAQGAADPRVEPNDIVTIPLPSPTPDEIIVVDSVQYSIRMSGVEVTMDMEVSGRDAS